MFGTSSLHSQAEPQAQPDFFVLKTVNIHRRKAPRLICSSRGTAKGIKEFSTQKLFHLAQMPRVIIHPDNCQNREKGNDAHYCYKCHTLYLFNLFLTNNICFICAIQCNKCNHCATTYKPPYIDVLLHDSSTTPAKTNLDLPVFFTQLVCHSNSITCCKSKHLSRNCQIFLLVFSFLAPCGAVVCQ